MRPRPPVPPRPRGAGAAALVCALVSASLLSACGRAGVFAGRRPEAGDVEVASVAGRPVWASDVRRQAEAEGQIGEGEPLPVGSQAFRRVLDELIDQRLLADEAVRQGLDRDPLVRRRLEAAREKLLGDVLVDSVVDKAVNEDAVRALYKEQRRMSRPSEEIRARQIVTATPQEAEAVRRLLASGASFPALAMKRSLDGATRFAGGDLGYFAVDAMPPAFQPLKGAAVGQIVGPVPVERGFALLQIVDRRPEPPISLDAARPQIVRFLTYDEIRGLLNRLRSGAKVKLLARDLAPPVDAGPPAAGGPGPDPRSPR